VELAPDIAAGRVSLEQLPDGVRATLSEQSLFPSGGATLDDKGRYILASLIEGLLDPRILRIVFAVSPAVPAGLQDARIRAVTHYFEDYVLGLALESSTPQQATPTGSVSAAPEALTITVSIISS
jgi:hypothetical protein